MSGDLRRFTPTINMKSSIKTIQDVGCLHDLRTYSGTVKKSGMPDLPTTAILNLSMRRTEKDRIEKELKRLKKRKTQLQKRLEDIRKEMKKLYEQAVKTAENMVTAERTDAGSTEENSNTEKKRKMVLRY